MDGQVHGKVLVGVGIDMVEGYGKDYPCEGVHEERQ